MVQADADVSAQLADRTHADSQELVAWHRQVQEDAGRKAYGGPVARMTPAHLKPARVEAMRKKAGDALDARDDAGEAARKRFSDPTNSNEQGTNSERGCWLIVEEIAWD